MRQASLEGMTLHVADVEKSLDFYRRIPGAQVVHHRPGQFAMLQIGKSRLGLLRRTQDKFHLEIEAVDLDEMYRQLKEAGLEPESPPVDRPWGERDFWILDPDGNTVEFGAARERREPDAD